MTIVLTVLLLGAAIGATGIGGVGLVPVLVDLADMPLQGAVPAALAAFVMTGFVGLAMHRRSLANAGRPAALVASASAIGAVAGAVSFPYVAGAWLEIAIGLLMLAVGALEIARRRGAGPPMASGDETPGADARATGSGAQDRWLPAIGFGVGLGSALTGTGGPVLFVPVMLMLGGEIRATIAIAQIIQIPIAGASTAIHLSRGALDLTQIVVIGGVLSVGAVAGALLARRMNAALLRTTVAAALLVGGIVFLALRLL